MRRLFRRAALEPRESAIQQAVLAHWKLLGEPDTLVACIPNAGALGQPGLTAGLPDLLVIGPDVPGSCRVGFLELKRDEESRVTSAQREFELLCRRLQVPHRLVVGRDEPITVLEEWKIVRRRAR